MTVCKVLSGHVSPETAYVVEDYPYGFKLRTKIRYWLEQKDRKGYRLCTQTLNPKNGRWNAPKYSTYSEFAAAMYLDENDHVKWSALGQYAGLEEIRNFWKSFPGVESKLLQGLVFAKISMLQGAIEQNEAGYSIWLVNGQKKPVEEGALEQHRKDLAAWQELSSMMKEKKVEMA